jgi:hypothetical protein
LRLRGGNQTSSALIQDASQDLELPRQNVGCHQRQYKTFWLSSVLIIL